MGRQPLIEYQCLRELLQVLVANSDIEEYRRLLLNMPRCQEMTEYLGVVAGSMVSASLLNVLVELQIGRNLRLDYASL